MPAFNASRNNNPITAVLTGESTPIYLIGSRNYNTDDTIMHVINVTGNGTTATLTVVVRAGAVPVVGQNVTVLMGVLTQFNTNTEAITAVSGFATGDKSQGTISYLSTASLGATVDFGSAQAPPAELAEALTAGSPPLGAYASMACAFQVTGRYPDQGRTVKATVSFPDVPTDVTVTLQDAIELEDVFTDVGNVVTVTNGTPSGGSAEFTLSGGRYYRFNASGLTGSGSWIAKLIA